MSGRGKVGSVRNLGGRRSRVSERLLLAGPAVGALCLPALAGPQGEHVVYGSAEFARYGSHTSITTSHRAIIDYSSFNIGSGESVRFYQPNSNSRVLNRINSDMPTHIDGRLQANGHVYFVNRAGVFFGANSVVDVAGIYAAAGNISNSDFLSGIDRFTGLTGDVVNHGTIEATDGVHFAGRHVANFGTVLVRDGVVTMSAGDEVFIGERNGHVFARISGSGPGAHGAAGVEQAGEIDVGGGQAVIGVGDHFALALWDTSRIRAERVRVKGGDGSHVTVAGHIDASDASRGATGGRVEVLGDYIALKDATIDVSGGSGGGEIRIGGDFHGAGELRTARGTYVSAGTKLRADALDIGHGGTIAVWADGATGFFGSLSARGGERGGDGGFAEVSGKDLLVFRGSADMRGTKGAGHLGANGQLLLDPTNIRVIDGGPGAGDFDDTATNSDFIFSAADANPGDFESTISNADLVTLLDTTDITLQANNDISIEGSIDASGNTGDHGLTLNAGRSILIGAGVEILLRGGFTATVNDVNAIADRDAGAAEFVMGAGSVIDTTFGAADGAISITSQDGLTGAELAGDLTLATLDAGSAGVSIFSTGDDGTVNIVGATAGGALITGSTVEIDLSGTGGAIGSSSDRVVIVTDTLAIDASAGVFLSLTGTATEIGAVGGTTGIATDAGNIDIFASEDLTVAAGATIESGSGSVRLEVPGLVVDGTIDAGTGVLSIVSADIELGVASGATDRLVLTNAELARLAGASLTIGEAGTTASVRVEGVDGAGAGDDVFAGFGAGGITLRGGTVEFAGAASTFTNIDVNAGTSITVGQNLTAETGGLTLSSALISIGQGLTLASGGALSTGDLTLTGAGGTVTLRSGADEGVSVGTVTSADDSALTIESDTGVSAGTINLGSGALTVDLNRGTAAATSSTFAGVTAGTVNFGTSGAGVGDTVTLTGAVNVGSGGVNLSIGASGTLILQSGADIESDAGITLAAQRIDLGADLTADSASIVLDGDVDLLGSGEIRLTIDNAGVTDLIDFRGTLDASGGAGLRLLAGGGRIEFDGIVGGGDALGGVEVVSADRVTIVSSFTASSFTAGVGGSVDDVRIQGVANTMTLTGQNASGNALEISADSAVELSQQVLATLAGGADVVVGANGNAITSSADVSISATGGITLQDALVANAGAGSITLTVGSGALDGRLGDFGALTGTDITIATGTGTNHELRFGGAVASSGVSGVSISAGTGGEIRFNSGSSITTTGGAAAGEGAVVLTGGVLLGSNLAIDTSGAGAAGGDVTFDGTVDGVTTTRNLTIDAGTGGAVRFNQGVGAGGNIGQFLLSNADSLRIDQAFATQNAFTATTAGADGVLINGALTTGGGAFSAAIGGSGVFTIGAGGSVNAGAGSVTILGDISLAGALNTSSDVQLTVAGSIGVGDSPGGFDLNISNADLAQISAANLLIGDDAVSTDVTGITADGVLASALSGVTGLTTLRASGTDADVAFSGAASGFGTLRVEADRDVLANAAIETVAGGVHMEAGSGSITGSGDVEVTSAQEVVFASDATAAGGISIVINKLDNGAGDVATTSSFGSLTASGGGIFVGNDPAEPQTNDDITFSGALAAGGAIEVRGADLAFGDTLTASAGGITVRGTEIGFNGALSATGGAIEVMGDATLDGVGATTNGFAITFTGDTTLAGVGGIAFDSTNGGAATAGANIVFDGALDAPGAADLTLDAGTAGTIRFTGAVGAGGALGDVLVSRANALDIQSTLAAESLTAAAGAGVATISTGGALTLSGTNAGGESVLLAASDSLTLGGDITGTSGDIDLDGGTDGITATGGLVLNAGAANDVILRSALEASGNVAITGTATLFGDVVTGGNNLTFNQAVDVQADGIALDAGAGTLTFSNSVTLGANDVAFVANAMDLLGGAGSVTGTGVLTIRPGADGVAIDFGTVTNPGGGLELSDADVAALGTGFDRVEIGNAATGAHTIQIAGQTFANSMVFHTPGAGGQIGIAGDLVLTGADSLTINGSGATTLLAGSITTAGGDVLIDDALSLAVNAAISTSGGSVTVTGPTNAQVVGAFGLTIDSDGGNISLGSVGQANRLSTLDLDAGAGTITFAGLHYAADVQQYEAATYSVDTGASGLVRLLATGGPAGDIEFVGGTIDIAADHDLEIRAGNGSVVMVDVTGAGRSLTVQASEKITLAGVGTGGDRLDDITLIAADLDLAEDIFGTGVLRIEQAADGQILDIAAAANVDGNGTLELTAAELGRINAGFSEIRLGNADFSGDVIFRGHAFDDSVRILGSGSIRIDGILAAAAGRDITVGDSGAGNASIRFNAPGTVQILADGGDVTLNGSVRLDVASAEVRTQGGALTVLGAIDAVGSGTAVLTLDAAAGDVQIADVGTTNRLSSLTITGGDVGIGSVGTASTLGVTGALEIDASGTITYEGGQYRAGSFSLTGTGGHVLTEDAVFAADLEGGDADFLGGPFTLAGNSLEIGTKNGDITIAGNVVGSSAAGERVTIEAGGGAVSVATLGSGANRLERVELIGSTIAVGSVFTQSATGSGLQRYEGVLTLNGSSYSSNGSGDIVFTANATGSSGVTINSGAGRFRFGGTLLEATDLTISGAGYDFTGTGTATVRATTGNVSFGTGGSIELVPGTNLSVIADGAGAGNGNVTLARVLRNGGGGVTVSARDTATLNGVGTSASTGVATLTVTADDLAFNSGDIFATNVTLRPFTASRNIRVADGTSGASLDITGAMLDRLRGLSALTIGRTGGTGEIRIGTATFAQSTDFVADGAGGRTRVVGPVTFAGGADATFTAATSRFDRGVALGTGNLSISGPATIGGPATFSLAGGTATFGGPVDGVSSGTGALTIVITGGGTLSFGGGIGATNRLESVSINAPAYTLGTVRTTGAQTYAGARTLNGANLSTLGGGISFTGLTTVLGDSLLSSGGGTIAFGGPVRGSGASADILRLNAGGGSVALGTVGSGGDMFRLGSLLVEDASSATFSGGVTTVGTIDIDAPAVLAAGGQVLTFRAGNVDFNAAVRSATQGGTGLRVIAGNRVTFAGDVGAGSGRLRSLETSGAGTVLLGADVFSESFVTLGGLVDLTSDVVVRTFGTGTADSITFGTVNSSTPGNSLTAIVDRSKGGLVNNRPDEDVPLIVFLGSVGQSGRLGELNLNFAPGLGVDGRGDIPVQATIVIGNMPAFVAGGAAGDFVIRAARVNMGRHEKLGAVGSLLVDASTSARLGDITAIGALTVNTPTLTILTRAASPVFDPIAQVQALDDGVDFVSAGAMAFNVGSLALDGTGAAPTFSAPGGNVAVPGAFLIRSFAESVGALASGPGGIFLDVRSLGPTNTNVAETIAGAVPRESQLGTIEEDTTVGMAAQDALREIGIYPRESVMDPNLTEEERVALVESILQSMLGRAIYEDLPSRRDPDVLKVTVERLAIELVDEILIGYRRLFVRERIDPETGQVVRDEEDRVIVDRRDRVVRDAIGDAFDQYEEDRQTFEIDPADFLAFLEEQGEDLAEARSYIAQLQQLVARARLLGLSPREMSSFKAHLYGLVLPEGIPVETLDRIIDRGPVGLVRAG